MNEYEFEAEHGLPEPLPANERLLWQGSPNWMRVARDIFHLRKLFVYFGLLLLWVGAQAWSDSQSAGATASALLLVLPVPACALVLLLTGAWLIAKTSVYTVTDKRVVMRIGIVLTVSFNIPLSRIQSLAVRSRGDKLGDIVLSLADNEQIAYLHLWPHVRPWHLRQTQPMLRCIAGAQQVAQMVAQTMAQTAAQTTVQTAAPTVATTIAPTSPQTNTPTPSPASPMPAARAPWRELGTSGHPSAV